MTDDIETLETFYRDLKTQGVEGATSPEFQAQLDELAGKTPELAPEEGQAQLDIANDGPPVVIPAPMTLGADTVPGFSSPMVLRQAYPGPDASARALERIADLLERLLVDKGFEIETK